MNNGVNETNSTIQTGKEEIKAAKVYKLTPENAPKELLKEEEKPWEKKKETPVEENKVIEQPKIVYKKSKNILARFLFLIILLMGAYIGFNYYNTSLKITRYNNLYSPVSTTKEAKELDINSYIVQDLYSKVKTNIREDIAEPQLNQSMKLYLAYRSIPHDKLFESTCDGFNNASMIPYTCTNNIPNFKPNAFKKEALEIEYKKLFGEYTDFENSNIQIGKNCIGGYQYIESRGEYVQGYCTSLITTTAKVNKKLVSATSKESNIVLKEEVKYTSSEGQSLPENLKSGTYNYVFKLDKNYNYIYVNKYLEQE